VNIVRTDVSEEYVASIFRIEGLTISVSTTVWSSVLINVDAVPISLILSLLKMVRRSSETSVQTRPIPRHIPEDGILQVMESFNGLMPKVLGKLQATS
jgi:hypothetical protein